MGRWDRRNFGKAEGGHGEMKIKTMSLTYNIQVTTIVQELKNTHICDIYIYTFIMYRYIIYNFNVFIYTYMYILECIWPHQCRWDPVGISSGGFE